MLISPLIQADFEDNLRLNFGIQVKSWYQVANVKISNYLK